MSTLPKVHPNQQISRFNQGTQVARLLHQIRDHSQTLNEQEGRKSSTNFAHRKFIEYDKDQASPICAKQNTHSRNKK
jgi:hypothetical protein